MLNSKEDESYKIKFNENYLKCFSKYLNIQKLEQRIPSYKYLVEHISKTDKALTEKDIKKLIKDRSKIKDYSKEGIPLQYMHQTLINCFRVYYTDSEYNTILGKALKGRKIEDLGDYLPLFTNKSFKESLPIHFLNEEGISVLKEIMWMINDFLPGIEYSPLIIKFVSMLLIFCTKEETYEIMRNILNENIYQKDETELKFQFRFNLSDYNKITESLKESLEEVKEIKSKFTNYLYHSNDVENIGNMIKHISESFFMEYLNFYGLIKFLPYFIYDGTKGIFKLVQGLFKKVEFNTINELIQSSYKILEIDELFKNSTHSHLSKKKNDFTNALNNNNNLNVLNKKNFYYLASFDTPSSVISEEEIVKLWSILPIDAKTFDCHLLFSSATNQNADLSNLYEICDEFSDNNFFMILIKTKLNEVFGGILSRNFVINSNIEPIQPDTAVLFSIRPTLQVYQYKKKNEFEGVIQFEPGAIRFGLGDDGAAFVVDYSLKEGWSDKFNVFGETKLLECMLDNNDIKDEYFEIANLEVYLLV